MSFGYFFRSGGSNVAIEDGIAEFHIEGFNERAFISLNKQQVVKAEIDDGNNVTTERLLPDRAFVFVLPVNAGSITFYDINGNRVEGIQLIEE